MEEQITFLEDIKPQKSNDWKWYMSTDYPPKNGLKVFSCFACGGGSTMGYKLAGCDVIGNCEIDKRMNDVYIANHHPKYNYLMDIRDFNTLNDLPQELYDLDILDGSPPCSTFSMAGNREEGWGKKKKFREGQVEQTLDDLLFVFIETVKKLRPKVVIMENVEGLLFGNAWKYVQKIYETFNQTGYKVKHWLLKGETMGVPQTRHRVFFVATRLNFDLDKVNMNFNYAPITYGEIKEGTGPVNKESLWYSLLSKALPQDKCLCDIRIRNNLSATYFTEILCWHDKILPTITAAKHGRYDAVDKTKLSGETIRNAQTFPQDYNFLSNLAGNICYICGMSVPPLMIKRLMTRLIESGLFNYKLTKGA